jgi:hypothetical protein
VKGVALAAALAAAIVLPVTLPYFAVRAEQGLERTIEEAEEYKATPGSYRFLPPWDAPNPVQQALGVRSGGNRSLTTVGQAPHADGHRHSEIVVETRSTPGSSQSPEPWRPFSAGTLPAGRWLRSRRWRSGQSSSRSGPPLVRRTEAAFPCPTGWLFERAPFFTAMRVPARLGGLAAFALVALGGLGVAGRGPAGGDRSPTGSAMVWLDPPPLA